MKSRIPGLETVVLQVCAGSLMGEAFVAGASFIFLSSQGAAQPRATANTAGPGVHVVPVPEQAPRSLQWVTLMAFLTPRCSSAHVGERCQLPNPCLSSPCKNAGTCIPLVRGSTADYSCVCRLGFTDELCLTPLDNACLNNPCRNGGTCDLVTLSEYKCRCPPGWSGEG